MNLTGKKETATLLLDIFPGNPVSAEYPELVSQLRGVSVVERTPSDALDPRVASRYRSDWLQVFRQYESAVAIQAPPRLLLPPFPLAAALRPPLQADKWLPAEIGAMAEGDQWNQMQRPLRQLLAAARFACERRVLDRCVNTADRTRTEHDFNLRFVTPFRPQLEAAAAERAMPS